MVNATNVSQKECSTPVKRGGKALNEEEINECLATGGIILPSCEMAMPLTEKESILAHLCPRTKNLEEQYLEIIMKIRKGIQCSPDEYNFLIKEGDINLRVVYGVYLSMCQKYNITKVITWRTFYMQCNGYRTLKPNTMAAISEYIHIRMGNNF